MADAEHGRDEQREKGDKRRQDWLNVFTALIALATFIYVGVSARQLIAMNSQLSAMNNQLWEQKHQDWATSNQLRGQLSALNGQVNAQATTAAAAESAANTAVSTLNQNRSATAQQLSRLDRSLVAANELAGASRKAADASARAVHDNELAQRANIRLTGSVDHSGSAIITELEVKNIGPTPAREIEIESYLLYTKLPTTQQGAIGRQDYLFGLMLKNGITESLAYLSPGDSTTPRDSTPGISAEDWDAMRTIRGGWVYAARVTYSDIYGRSHWTNLCTFENGNDYATYCKDHNDQGDFPARVPTK